MVTMLDVLIWIVAVEVAGLAVLPLCHYIFPGLRDRGYSLSKPLGILICAYFSWILSALHLLPSTQITVFALILVIAIASLWRSWSSRVELLQFFWAERKIIFACEAVFLVTFLGWVLLRGYDPSISHTEQPMDFAFLNASIRTYLGQPVDPWLSGHSISYYYFGYWMMGVISKLTSVSPSVAYNLSLALLPALSASGVFGLVLNMIRTDSNRIKYLFLSSVSAAVLVTIAANLEGFLELLAFNQIGTQGFWGWIGVEGLGGSSAQAGGFVPQENWWWWRATRVIGSYVGISVVDYTIHEFPFFSFLLGDLHPHVMSIPFVTLFLAMSLNLLNLNRIQISYKYIKIYVIVFLMGLSLGALAFVNMWDLPVFSAVFFGVLILRSLHPEFGTKRRFFKEMFGLGFPTIIVAVVLFLPYYFTFTSQVSGIGATGPFVTRPIHFFVVWGALFAVVIPFVVSSFYKTNVREGSGILGIIAGVISLVPYIIWAFIYLEQNDSTSLLIPRFLHVLPITVLVGIGIYTTLWLGKFTQNDRGSLFAVAISTISLLLIIGPELLYIDDAFGGSNERMNTVFKLYYQAWILLAIASGCAIYYLQKLIKETFGWRMVFAKGWALSAVILLTLALYYPFPAIVSKSVPFREDFTLDGLDHLQKYSPGEYLAIKEVRKIAMRNSVILEAVGEEIISGVDLNGDGDTRDIIDYSDYSRISGSTGVATVLGWIGHENQWRGGGEIYEGRIEDVMEIYTTSDIEKAKMLMGKYGVDLVYIGHRERKVYGQAGLSKFSEFMDKIFESGDVLLYRVRP